MKGSGYFVSSRNLLNFIVSFCLILLLFRPGIATAESATMHQDKIPIVKNPEFIPASKATFLEDDDLVLGVIWKGQAKAYPIRILGLYEVINDRISDKPVAATW